TSDSLESAGVAARDQALDQLLDGVDDRKAGAGPDPQAPEANRGGMRPASDGAEEVGEGQQQHSDEHRGERKQVGVALHGKGMRRPPPVRDGEPELVNGERADSKQSRGSQAP